MGALAPPLSGAGVGGSTVCMLAIRLFKVEYRVSGAFFVLVHVLTVRLLKPVFSVHAHAHAQNGQRKACFPPPTLHVHMRVYERLTV